MKIKWFGHSCFLLTSESGVRIVIDPFNREVGYAVPSVEADIVTISHGHGDHNYVEAVKGGYRLLNKPGRYSEKGIEINGVATAHDERNGRKRGDNIVFTYAVDGIKICHCGDLGHILTESQVKEIGTVDILMVPVGGFYTIDYKAAATVSRQLGPSVTIPMHFKTKETNFPIETEERFLNESGGGKRVNKQEIELDRDNLGGYAGVIVLSYK